MGNWDNLRKLEVDKESAVEFEFYEFPDPCPVLFVKCTVGNSAYHDAIRTERESIERKLNKKKNKGRKRTNRDINLMKLLRDPDRRHYPGNIIVGWKNNIDDDGTEVEFSDEECADFLQKLPDYLFDRLRYYVIEPKHFIDTAMSSDDEEALTGN